MKYAVRVALVSVVAVLVVALVGCSKSDNPTSSLSNTPAVGLSISFSKASSGVPLAKSVSVLAADSLKIDSAIVVLQRIKFESHVDTVKVDSTGMMSDGMETDNDPEVTFKGPFVIHVRDTVAIDFASQTLPAGTYDGIKFKIHRLQAGEKHEDSDEHNGHPAGSAMDTTSYGYGIVVWGSVKKNGVWTPFVLKYDGELEFKIKGNFVVSTATSQVSMALNFNMGLWFKNPHDGSLLDPTDSANKELFKEAIKRAFENGRGGRDSHHSGHPDD